MTRADVATAVQGFIACINTSGLSPSDRCPNMCDVVNPCSAKTFRNDDCNKEISTDANCVATDIVRHFSEDPAFAPCDCSTPAAPSTSLGLVASVLKKNLRA
eukprot:CAMPEP_0201681682 /NCGR_PEP_ID=MMETSP0494-20130426/51237_1 /ASSEMBLY_ACC=CAM_ASM_000839 /TAXON_ID=420259 /ORGANISM="Thalassiosira gravida, Strain GMp14c1" /LENGTH=101 /DNA_ID=CAMNT_0048165433 /DNA_START=284 /DNA_END=589 /DNA_ORIENTATION=-